jgi:hypothetical protein
MKRTLKWLIPSVLVFILVAAGYLSFLRFQHNAILGALAAQARLRQQCEDVATRTYAPEPPPDYSALIGAYTQSQIRDIQIANAKYNMEQATKRNQALISCAREDWVTIVGLHNSFKDWVDSWQVWLGIDSWLPR